MDIFWYYLSTLIFVCVLSSLFCVYRYYLGNKLTAQANKLKSQIANIRREFPEIEGNRTQMVGNALGEIGIDGVLDELGIPSVFKPLAKGFIDKLAQNPEMIKGLAEKIGIKLPEGNKKDVAQTEGY
jgi:hypothetical protein